MTEVQITGFEHTHHLQSDGRFAVERNAAGRHHPIDQSHQCLWRDFQLSTFDQRVETVNLGIGFEQRFAVELVKGLVVLFLRFVFIHQGHLFQRIAHQLAQGGILCAWGKEQSEHLVLLQFGGVRKETVVRGQLSGQLIGLLREHAGIRMFQQTHHLGKKKAPVIGIVAFGVQLQQRVQKTVGRCLRHGESHSDIHVAHFAGQGMKHGWQQCLVAEDYSRFLFLLGKILAKPLGQITDLGVLGRGLHISDFLRAVQIPEKFRRQFGREIPKVATDEFAGLVRMLLQIEFIIVPVERGHARFMKAAKECMLHLVQHVESHEHIALMRKRRDIQLFDDFPIEHSFVGQSLSVQHIPELAVDVSQL